MEQERCFALLYEFFGLPLHQPSLRVIQHMDEIFIFVVVRFISRSYHVVQWMLREEKWIFRLQNLPLE